eukprot:CAMPEP_0181364888 /NCGR_PEP_ID=MMETSP1106-20121128/9706_1 /TAXON_ID=81844 /ORGANISM="Mantoniella antarctica, Strain SL-175" /LENGTH=185 /DNA_ID=CAMNT_0023479791 /DNA_START=118 /DNA_END=675 /DNA_ORIENTATION=+
MASPLAVGSAVGSSGAVFQRPKESVVRRKRICTNRSRRVVRATAANGTVAPVTLNDDVNFYQVRAVIRPWRLDNVVRSLNIIGIGGLTTYDVQGAGVQAGAVERYAGTEFGEKGKLVKKTCVEVVVCRDQVQEVVDVIIEAAQTGEIGDGKIFLYPVADVVRIRTGEVGADAERMVGGRSDMRGT